MATDSGTDKSASHGPGLALPLPTVTSFQKNTGLRTTGFAISASLTKRIFCWMLKLEAYCDQHPHDNLEMSLPLLELKQPTQRQQQVGPEASWSRPDGCAQNERPVRTSQGETAASQLFLTRAAGTGTTRQPDRPLSLPHVPPRTPGTPLARLRQVLGWTAATSGAPQVHGNCAAHTFVSRKAGCAPDSCSRHGR